MSLNYKDSVSTGWTILMTVTSGDTALQMIPSFEEYDSRTEFLSFACLESDYSEIPVEWLDPNGDVMIPTTETARVDGKEFVYAYIVAM